MDPSLPMAQSALETAQAELRTGIGDLRSFYSHLFLISPSILRDMQVSRLREWLRNVRIARESSSSSSSVTDDFSPNGQFRAWLFRK